MEDTGIREMLADAQAYNNALAPGTLSIENIFSQAGHAVAFEDMRYFSMQEPIPIVPTVLPAAI